MKKHPFSLMEVIVAMGLFSVLLTALFSWYFYFSMQKRELSASKWPVLEEHYCQERLSSILSHATLNSEKGITAFYSSNSDLIFTFDNGVWSQPELSNIVLARLYLDADTLCLTIWPQPNREHSNQTPSETLVLLDRVSNLSYDFYAPPNPFAIVAPKEVGHEHAIDGWQQQWYASYNALPALITLSFTRDDKPIKLAFDLPYPLIYKESL